MTDSPNPTYPCLSDYDQFEQPIGPIDEVEMTFAAVLVDGWAMDSDTLGAIFAPLAYTAEHQQVYCPAPPEEVFAPLRRTDSEMERISNLIESLQDLRAPVDAGEAFLKDEFVWWIVNAKGITQGECDYWHETMREEFWDGYGAKDENVEKESAMPKTWSWKRFCRRFAQAYL